LMALPSSLNEALTQALQSPPQHAQSVSGGDINLAARFMAGGQAFLVKWNHSPLPNMFSAEAKGLKLLAEAQALRVPRVYAYDEVQEDCPAFIVLEWLDTTRDADRGAAAVALGRGLAAQHGITADAYGLDHDNYCGATPQPNNWLDSWIEFYGERRLGFQMELAAQRGYMPSKRRKHLERLIAQLDKWIDEGAAQPSLLHGDLWGGNWMIGPQGEPVLIDPAVYYGDREAELAMCHLFGGFPAQFYRAYDGAWPPAPGRDERLALYQLYHLLNHLNLFGEGYGSRVDDILRRYVG
jgi:fructosamine-3-kinase